MPADLPNELRFPDKAAADKFLSRLSFKSIAGVDEVGRGPMAGPVVAACVLLPPDHGIVGIRDSKKLSSEKREVLVEQIISKGFWGIGARDNEEVDRLNIYRATLRAAEEAVWRCIYTGAAIDYLLCDGGLDLKEVVPFPATSALNPM